MAKVQLTNVTVLDNSSPFSQQFRFELVFECIEELKEGKFFQTNWGNRKPGKI
jgi:Histone chaperone involved in gene silencing